MVLVTPARTIKIPISYFLSHRLSMNALSLPTEVDQIDGLIEAFGKAV